MHPRIRARSRVAELGFEALPDVALLAVTAVVPGELRDQDGEMRSLGWGRPPDQPSAMALSEFCVGSCAIGEDGGGSDLT
jgi:hypothetical protein